jgi:hypothetical protein
VLARDYLQKDEKRGVRLMAECTTREDFTDLSILLVKPWGRVLDSSEPLQVAFAQVVARRGGYVEGDTQRARKNGASILDVPSALKGKRAATAGKLVLVRGVPRAIKSEKWGKGKSQVLRFEEWSWTDDDGEILEQPEATGRDVFIRVETVEPRFKERAPMLAVVRLEGPRVSVRPGDDEHDEISLPSVIGSSVAFFDVPQRVQPTP